MENNKEENENIVEDKMQLMELQSTETEKRHT